MVECICSIACDLVRLSRPALVAAYACPMKAAAEMTLTTLPLRAIRCEIAACIMKNGAVRFAETSRVQSSEVTSTNACMRSRSTTLQSRSNPPNASTASCTTRVQAACVPRSATPVTQPVPPFSRISPAYLRKTVGIEIGQAQACAFRRKTGAGRHPQTGCGACYEYDFAFEDDDHALPSLSG